MNIGYVGLGNMGGALARRMQLSRPLRVYDLRPESVSALVDKGAIATQDGASLARESDVVMTCLPTSQNVREAIFGAGGLLEGLAPGKIIIDQTTGDPNETRAMAAELRAHGVELVDAPVSGGIRGADAGTIALMVGASDELFAKVRPVLELISPNIFHCGGTGNGHVMKLVNNVTSACIRAATYEAVSMGAKNGLSLATMAEVMNKGTSYSSTTANHMPKLLSGSRDVNFALGLMLKDVRLATQLGIDSGAPMMIGNMVRGMLQSASYDMGPDVDMNEIIRPIQKAANVTVVDW
ncbi:MAG: NAD(P)-dependent oxidoreductase [Proteobacteria bacterium]|nr:NAD(P)-dependent oxidoreductase [Pseudomonadota bacterium]